MCELFGSRQVALPSPLGGNGPCPEKPWFPLHGFMISVASALSGHTERERNRRPAPPSGPSPGHRSGYAVEERQGGGAGFRLAGPGGDQADSPSAGPGGDRADSPSAEPGCEGELGLSKRAIAIRCPGGLWLRGQGLDVDLAGGLMIEIRNGKPTLGGEL